MSDGFSDPAAGGVDWVDQGDGTHAAVVDVDGDDVADVALLTDGVHTIITDGTEAIMVDDAGAVVAVDPEGDGQFSPVTVDDAATIEEPVTVEDEVVVRDPVVVEEPVVVPQDTVVDDVPEQPADPGWYLDPGFERSPAEIAEDLDHWFEQTTSYTCAPASAAMVINDFADAPVVSETGVAVYAAENDLLVGEVGTLHMEGVAQILTAHGVPATPVPNGTWEQVDGLLESGRSVILGVDASQYWDGMEGAGPAGHAVRIVDVDVEAGVAVLADPGVPDGQGLVVPLEDLDRAWSAEMPLNAEESASRVMVVTDSANSDADAVDSQAVDADAAPLVSSEPAPMSQPLTAPVEDPTAAPLVPRSGATMPGLDLDLRGAVPGEVVDLPDGGLASNGFVLMAAAVPAPLALLLRTIASRRSS